MENTEEQLLPRAEKSWAEIIFFIIFFMLLIGSVAVTYYKIVVEKNYLIEAQTDCDPTTENCFIWNCDPESTEEGEACTGDAEVDTWYYKLVTKKAANIPLCDPETDETCNPLACESEEGDCAETFCDDENKLEQGVECSNPEEYLLDNPLEEEDIDNEEGDLSDMIDDETEDSEGVAEDAIVDDISSGDNLDSNASGEDNVSSNDATGEEVAN